MSDKKKAPRIHGVDVNRDAIKKAGSLDEFKRLNPHIFDHLGVNENAAYDELYKEFSPAPKTVPPAPSGEAVKP